MLGCSDRRRIAAGRQQASPETATTLAELACRHDRPGDARRRGRRGRSVRRRVPRCEALVGTELAGHFEGEGGAGLGLGGGRRGRHNSHFRRPFHLKATKSRSRAIRHPVPLGLCAPLSPARSTNKAKQDRHGRRAVPPILPSAKRANAQLLPMPLDKIGSPTRRPRRCLDGRPGRAFLRRAERNALAKGQRPTALR